MDIEYSSQVQAEISNDKRQNKKQNRNKKSKYEEIFGKTEENYRLAKLRFKNSPLMPPPPQIEEKQRKILQKAKDKYKRKLSKLFTNLLRKDIQAKTNFQQKNCFNRKKDYLDQREMQFFIQQIKVDIQSRLKSFMRTTEDYFKDNLYSEMKRCINTIKKWVQMIENRVEKMYHQRIQSSNMMTDILQKINWYSQFMHVNNGSQNCLSTGSQRYQRQLMMQNIANLNKQMADLIQKQSTPKILEYILNQRIFRSNFVLDSDSNTDNDD